MTDASVPPNNAQWGLLFPDRTVIPMSREEAEMHAQAGVTIVYRTPGPWTALNGPSVTEDSDG